MTQGILRWVWLVLSLHAGRSVKKGRYEAGEPPDVVMTSRAQLGPKGTLGIVLEADVQLLPNPKELLNGIIFFPSDEASLAALAQWRAVAGLRMLEYVDGLVEFS
jgi:hypothetical protein